MDDLYKQYKMVKRAPSVFKREVKKAFKPFEGQELVYKRNKYGGSILTTRKRRKPRQSLKQSFVSRVKKAQKRALQKPKKKKLIYT